MADTYFIDTMGCQMNERDSETIAGVLESLGFARAETIQQARVIVLNTCAVREKPQHKVFSKLGDIRKLKERRPETIVVVAGCVAQVAHEQIRARAPFVDVVIGPRSIAGLAEAIRKAADGGLEVEGGSRSHKRQTANDLSRSGERSYKLSAATVLAHDAEIVPEGLAFRRNPGVGAFVNVTYGCNNFCAYCIVPYARGREQSREPGAIIAEVRDAVAQGHTEVTLLGQNVNSYRGDGSDSDRNGSDRNDSDSDRNDSDRNDSDRNDSDSDRNDSDRNDSDSDRNDSDRNGPGPAAGVVDFADLLAMVDAVEGLQRLRFTTSHPKDLSMKLLDAMRDLPSVCEHLHLPIQSGDDGILARMGRGYTYAHYRSLVDAARERMPGIAITTDVMVGFPGETEAQFENTLRAFEEVRFDQAFMFKYSDRPGTRAASLPDKVPEEVKQERLVRLVELQNRIGREVNRELVGREFEVLVEGPDAKSPGKLRGRTRTNKIVVFGPADIRRVGSTVLSGHRGSSQEMVGEMAMVRAEEAYLWGFVGRSCPRP